MVEHSDKPPDGRLVAVLLYEIAYGEVKRGLNIGLLCFFKAVDSRPNLLAYFADQILRTVCP